MKISSFDIFDTCLVRKCGTPENFFDVFSLKVFNHEVPEWARQEFVAARRLTEQKLWRENPRYTLQDIWVEFDWSHQFLKPKKELCQLEQELEREMLVPVLSMRDKVNECRKYGDKIIFISDMYLSSDFLIDILRNYGFYQDGDALYVSCECGAMKWDGELFEYVCKQENLPSFRHWHHYGDNKQGDYNSPKKLGIKCTLINHAYTPYQRHWINNDYSAGMKIKAVIAGLSRAICLTTPYNTHQVFLTDIVSPLFSSFVYRIMKNASERGIKRLYFCARDAYTIYLIALKYRDIFPDVEPKYLYISQKSLYRGNQTACLQYFIQEGLATTSESIALVDIRSTGKTIAYINNLLETNGFKRVRGYYFEIIKSSNVPYKGEEVIAEWQDVYAKLNPRCGRISSFWQIYEMFFSIHNQNRTIDYVIKEDGKAYPVFDEGSNSDIEEKKVGNAYVIDSKKWEKIHHNVILSYTDMFKSTSMYLFSDIIFEEIAMPTFIRFMELPLREYSIALKELYVYSNNKGRYIPYVQKESLLHLLITRGNDTYWKRATKILSLPQWIVDFYERKYN